MRGVGRDVRVQCDRGALYGAVRGVAVAADGEVRLVVQGADGEPWVEDPRPEDVDLL